ncbi:MAG: hypothetical protein ATN31_03810 [Candidatus Epulonipiscioides saccharophilum]|nr:MAG: hypothetical protein ATN31_03810 [Epulopiscium sp. AS2M-Bin001]
MEILLGPLGSGKTHRCYEEIIKTLKMNKKDKIIMIVPDQFSLEVELELAERLYPGLLLVEVSSFSKLVYKANIEIPMLNELERIMILKKVIEDNHKELKFFTKSYNKDGFIEKVNNFLVVCENYGINDFKDENLNGNLKDKLADLSKINHWFYDFINTKFLTIEGSLHVLIKILMKTQEYKDALIIVDGFYSFSNAQEQVILALNSMARRMIITLPVADNNQPVNEHNIYYKSLNTLARFENKVRVIKKEFINNIHSNKNIDILYILNNYFSAHKVDIPRHSNNVTLMACNNLEDEVVFVAQNIKKFIRDKGYRYNDIAIIMGNINLYRSHITTIFQEYEIPYFLDETRNIQANPAVNLIINLLEVIAGHWNLNAILAFLKSDMLHEKITDEIEDKKEHKAEPENKSAQGTTAEFENKFVEGSTTESENKFAEGSTTEINKNFTIEDVDYLENYLYEQGINYKSKWLNEWIYADKKFDLKRLNALRLRIVEIITDVEKDILSFNHKGKITISNLLVIIYNFLVRMQVSDTINEWAVYHKQAGNISLEREYLSIYKTIMKIFERLVDILGNEYVKIATFKNILNTCFRHEKIAIIPATQDQIVIGELQRTRLPNKKIVFLLGLNDGVFPQYSINESIFSDMDLTHEIFTSNKLLYDSFVYSNFYGTDLEIYAAITKPKEYLLASYAMGDDEGKITRPSIVFTRLAKLFRMNPAKKESFVNNIYTSKQTMGELGQVIKNKNILSDVYTDTLRWYFENEKETIMTLLESLFYTNDQSNLNSDLAIKLYSNNSISVSRMEKFRKCPCSYFIQYGLQVEDRKLFKFKTPDIGTIFHSVLEIYPQLLKQSSETWTSVDIAKQEELVHQAVQESVIKANTRKIEGGQTRYLIKRIEHMSNRAISAIKYQLEAGKFEPQEFEYKFDGRVLPPININLGYTTLHLTGTIDRIDIFVMNGKEYVKIIDYKSGQTNFNFAEVFYALQLQLLLYLDAYLKINKSAKGAGVYYFKLDASSVDYSPGKSPEYTEQALLKMFKLSGLTLDDQDIAKAIEPNLQSQIIDVKYKKSGESYASSLVATEEEFDSIRKFIMLKVKELSREILEGKISIKPYKLGNKTGCDYCNYHSICGFDQNLPNNNYDVLEKISKKEALDEIQKIT